MLESFLSPFRCLRLLFSFSLWFASLNSVSFRDKKENDFRKTPFFLLLLPIAFSRCTSVSLLLVHKKG